MSSYTIALFGEATAGQFQKPYLCHTLDQLLDTFGNPPEECSGLTLAIQTLLFEHDVIFFRVHAEGFSSEDYITGLQFLKSPKKQHVDAIGIPGVGDREILEETTDVCHIHKSFLILTEKDLHDYLTSSSN